MRAQSLYIQTSSGGSLVKYLARALGGKMSKHFLCELWDWRGEERRWRDKLTQTEKYFHIVLPSQHMEGARSIHMQMEVHLLNLCNHRKAKKKRHTVSASTSLLFANVKCRSVCIFHIKLLGASILNLPFLISRHPVITPRLVCRYGFLIIQIKK